MRVIRPASVAERRWAVALALSMLLVGGIAIVIMAMLPTERTSAVAALGVSAALGIGVGSAMLPRALRGRTGSRHDDDLGRLLATAFDDNYVLVLAPRLPEVSHDLAALVIGPPGVRAVVARRWRGRYRVRGRGWEYDTRSRDGWIPCRTNPSFDADEVADAVARWARAGADEPSLPVAPAVAFPRSYSTVVLEEPDTEVVTPDNVPWWAQRIGRVQRMDAARVNRLARAVLDAADDLATPVPEAIRPGA
jgi:hypothetical protein